MKICSKCKIEKDEPSFDKNQTWCKKCKKEYRETHKEDMRLYRQEHKKEKSEHDKTYRSKHKEKIIEKKKIFYQENRENILNKHKDYYADNKDELSEKAKIYYEENKEAIRQATGSYYEENKEKILEKQKVYYIENKQEITKRNKIYRKENKELINEYYVIRRKNDPVFALRGRMSTAIGKMLKQRNASKNGYSVLDYLPYTMEGLKIYLEKLFEPWMTWENHGTYNSKTWNDDDSSTWTWQIDHIIPQSDLPYSSMEDENFKICWAVENLRPLSAKKNFLDGVHRTRHNRI